MQTFDKNGNIHDLVERSEIEYGSNDYGEYWMFPNGIMICKGKVEGNFDMVNSNIINGCYQSAIDLEYPRNFIEPPSVSVSFVGTGDGIVAWNDTLKGMAKIIVIMNNSTNPNRIRIRFSAIGRWK